MAYKPTILTSAEGGTGASNTATSGKILIGNGTNFVTSTPTYPNASATTGKILISDGTNFVTSTPTYPNTSGTAGKVLVSDGTNNVYSTPTFPNASATSGKIIKSDGTNWLASTETYAAPGTSGNVMTSDGTNWTSAAASSGTPILTTRFTASGTWTKSTSPAPKLIRIIAWGGGGGGASGRKGLANSSRPGGGGGAAGQFINYLFDQSVFSSSETVTIGGTANGGAAQTTNSTNGNPGTVGNDTSIGSIVIAKGGNAGGVGGTSIAGTGQQVITNFVGTLANATSGAGSTGLTNASAGATADPGIACYAATGGGGGGGINASNVECAGAAGGPQFTTDGVTVQTAGGTSGGIATGGGAGNVFSVNYFNFGATGGGGGGGSKTVNGGDGANGGTPSGGGGGGGAALDSVGNSGKGGNGARGELWVIEYF